MPLPTIGSWQSTPNGKNRGAPMKELSLEEVNAIAGGLPPGASLDEILYRAPAEPLRDPVEFARLAVEEACAAD